MRSVLKALAVIVVAFVAVFIVAFDYFDDWREFRSQE